MLRNMKGGGGEPQTTIVSTLLSFVKPYPESNTTACQCGTKSCHPDTRPCHPEQKHVMLNLFQHLSLIKSLDRKETKSNSISPTMVNNKPLPALGQNEQTTRHENSVMLNLRICGRTGDKVESTTCHSEQKHVMLNCGFADGRSETSPDSEQIEHTVAKPQMRNSVSVEQIQDGSQHLSLIKSLDRKETKPKSISTTMVNNNILPALEQNEKTTRHENSVMLNLFQYLRIFVSCKLKNDKNKILKQVQDDMGWFRCDLFGALAPVTNLSLFTSHFSPNHLSPKSAFTLAEMMVVMLILSIVMAAFAPVMTTRSKVDLSSPWRYMANNSDIYYGTGANQTAVIGANSKADTASRLEISTSSDTQRHILFKRGATVLGSLFIGPRNGSSSNNIILGNATNEGANNTGNIVIGINSMQNSTVGSSNVVIGNSVYSNCNRNVSNTCNWNMAIAGNSLQALTSGWGNLAIGGMALQHLPGGSTNIALGVHANMNANSSADNTIAVGYETLASANNAISMGNAAQATSDNTVAIGLNAGSTATNGVAIGNASKTNGVHSVAIGASAAIENGTTDTRNAIAIGNSAKSGNDGSIAIGVVSHAFGYRAIALGGATADQDSAIAIGQGAQTKSKYSIAIGNTAQTISDADGSAIAIGNGTKSDLKSISIGDSTTAYGKSSIAIGNNAITSSSGQPDSAIGAIAIGANTYDLKKSSFLSNNKYYYASQAKADHAIAIGTGTLANANNATAMGHGAHATGMYSTAIGGSEYLYRPNGTNLVYNYLTTLASGTDSIAIGSGPQATGNWSIAIGTGDHQNGVDANTTIASGITSIAIGYAAKARGISNTAIGKGACSDISDQNYVTCIGYNSGSTFIESPYVKSDSSYETVLIGSSGDFLRHGTSTPEHANGIIELYKSSSSAVMVLNADLIVKGTTWLYMPDHKNWNDASSLGLMTSKPWENSVEFHKGFNNKSDSTPLINSDRRLKYVGAELKSGLDKIRQLKVYNYTFKKDPKKTPHVGVIAQDLQKVFPNAVTTGSDGYLEIRMEDMFYALINAVKELDAKVTALTAAVKEHTNVLKEHTQTLQQLRKENKEIKARLDRLERQSK